MLHDYAALRDWIDAEIERRMALELEKLDREFWAAVLNGEPTRDTPTGELKGR